MNIRFLNESKGFELKTKELNKYLNNWTKQNETEQ